jgi:hypothetical protein
MNYLGKMGKEGTGQQRWQMIQNVLAATILFSLFQSVSFFSGIPRPALAVGTAVYVVLVVAWVAIARESKATKGRPAGRT